MSEYDYVTCGPREVRAITGPPTYDITPKLSGEPIDYACTETRRRANAIFLHTSKEPEIEKSRKKVNILLLIKFIHFVFSQH